MVKTAWPVQSKTSGLPVSIKTRCTGKEYEKHALTAFSSYVHQVQCFNIDQR